MNTAAILKAPDRRGDERPLPRSDGLGAHRHRTPGDIGLWVFMAVATSLFALFIAAYVMRMNASDWSPVALPRQLWLSTSLLVAGSVAMQLAASTSMARPLMLAGGIFALAFLGAQWWSWQALLEMRVMPVGNPAASFFYLLTAMHAFHVIGGILAWTWAVARMQQADARRQIALCARYWHFLLAVWLVLYATFTGLTPQLVAIICGR